MKNIHKKSIVILTALSLTTGVFTGTTEDVKANSKVLKKETTANTKPANNSVNYELALNKKMTFFSFKINADTQAQFDIAVALLQHKDSVDLSKYNYTKSSQIISDVFQVNAQNPLIFGLKSFKIQAGKDGSKKVLFSLREKTTEELSYELSEFRGKMDYIISEIYSEKDSEINKIRRIYDYLNENMLYNFVAQREIYKVNGSASKLPDIFYQYQNPTVFTEGNQGVCDAFTGFAKLYLEKIGFEAVTVTGRYKNGVHSWLKVKTTKGWLNYDFTRTMRDEKINYLVHGLTDAQLKTLGYVENTNYVTVKKKASMSVASVDYDYFRSKKQVYKDITALSEAVVSSFSTTKPMKDIQVRIEKPTTQTAILTTLKNSIKTYNKTIDQKYNMELDKERKRKELYDKALANYKKNPKKYKKPAAFKPKKIVKGKKYISVSVLYKDGVLNANVY